MAKRSARSIPTGPGTRGGQWDDPAFRRAYHRRWRAEHPEYREREERRRREVRHAERLRLDRIHVELLAAGALRLTRRQRQIIAWLHGGYTQKEVAHRLGISPHTVRNHLQNAYAALAVTTLLGALNALGWL